MYLYAFLLYPHTVKRGGILKPRLTVVWGGEGVPKWERTVYYTRTGVFGDAARRSLVDSFINFVLNTDSWPCFWGWGVTTYVPVKFTRLRALRRVVHMSIHSRECLSLSLVTRGKEITRGTKPTILSYVPVSTHTIVIHVYIYIHHHTFHASVDSRSHRFIIVIIILLCAIIIFSAKSPLSGTHAENPPYVRNGILV